jgi:hypothetical protein
MLLLLTAWAALTAILWPALIGRDILGFRDMLHNYGPMRELFWQGDISLWNDRAFGGGSVLADIVQQPFYLGQLLMRAIHAPAWPGIPIQLWIHELLGMAATWWLLRRFVPPDAAGIGAAAFGLCGFSIANLSNSQWACAQMWAPAVLLAADAWAVEGGFARGCLLAVCLPQPLLAGDPLLCGLLGLTMVAWVMNRRRRPLSRLAAEGALIAAAAAVIVSPQLVATFRAFPSLARSAGLPRAVREQWSLHPARIAELFVPRMFGPLLSDGFWGQFTVSPPWHRNYIHSIYAGGIGPALVAAAVWKRQRKALPWVLIACAALALSMGDSFLHLYGRLGDWIPPLRVFRYPQRMMALFAIAWAALLALGAAEIGELPRTRRLALGAASFAFGFAALASTAALAPAPDSTAVWRSGIQLAIAGAASLAALMLPSRHAGAAIGLVLIADLCAANAELLGLLPRTPLLGPPAACEALDAARGQRRIDSFRVFVDQDALSRNASRDWEAERLREYNHGKRNLIELCGYRETVSLNSLDPADQLRLWHEVSPLRTLRVMGTRFAITSPESAQWFGGAIRYTDTTWHFVVVELREPEPLLFRPARVEHISSADLPAAARARPELLETGVAALDVPALPHESPSASELVSFIDLGDEMHFRVRQSGPGYWVLAAALDQDWVARVDGAPAPFTRSDLVRRAIWLPAGEHRVSLEYAPTLPLALFALSTALTIVLVALGVRLLLQQSSLTPGAAI